MRGRMQGFELAQVASTPALGNVEAGIVASLTSLRFSVVSGGIRVRRRRPRRSSRSSRPLPLRRRRSAMTRLGA